MILENMNEIAKTPLNALIRNLVFDDILTYEEAHNASIATLGRQGALVKYLIEELNLDDELIAEKASNAFGIPLFDLKIYYLAVCKLLPDLFQIFQFALPLTQNC